MDLDIIIPEHIAAVLSYYDLADTTIADLLRAVIDEHTGEMASHIDFLHDP
jgi:hypothetical protein